MGQRLIRVPKPRRMFTWISKTLLGAGAALALAACQMDPAGGDTPPSRFSGPPPARMGVAHGAVVVAGPRGFCIDREVSQDARGAQALTVLSACRGLGAGVFGPAPVHPAVLTAAVAPPGRLIDVQAAEGGLVAYFQSTRGRAALSRSGRADTVRLQEGFAEDGAFFLHLTDSAPFAWGAVQPDYWRALLETGGRMVTVAVLAQPGSPLTRDQGLAVLRDFIAATRNATAQAAKPKS